MATYSNFADIGVRVQASKVVHIHEVGGVKTETEFALFMCMLPSAPKVQASFSREGVAKKIVKLFKKELQVGDKTFDDAVYVSTDTPKETAALLASEKTQNTILMCVVTGGYIEIEGPQVKALIPATNLNEDPSLYAFVQALMAVS
jgi:hypothetical protein